MKTTVTKSAILIKYPSCGRASTEKLVNLGLAEMGLKLKGQEFEKNMKNLKVTLKIDECIDFLGYTNERKKESISQLVKAIEPNKKITLKNNEYEIDKAHMISRFGINMKDKLLTLHFNAELIDLLFLLEEYTDKDGGIKTRIKKDKSKRDKTIQYITYDMIMFKDTSSGFIIRLYEIFKLFVYKGDEGYFVKIEDLKSMLGMQDNKSYSVFSKFNDKILKVAINYINKNTDLVVILNTKKCKKVSFKIEKKDKNGSILLNGCGKPLTKLQYKIDTIAFFINIKENIKIENEKSDLVVKSLFEVMDYTIEEITTFVELLKNKLASSGINITYKQIESLVKKCEGNKYLVFAIIQTAYSSKTRKKDFMKYAWGIAEQAMNNEKKKQNLIKMLYKSKNN